jgi:hypothetical protein
LVKELKDVNPEDLKKLLTKLDIFAKEQVKIFGEVLEFTGASNIAEAYKTLGELVKESLKERGAA